MILIQLIVIYKKKRYLYDLYTFRKHNAVLSDSDGTSWLWQVNLLLSPGCACSCKSPVLIHAIFYKKDLFYDPLWLILAVFCCRLQQPVTCGIECTRSIKKQCCSFHKASDCGITSNVFFGIVELRTDRRFIHPSFHRIELNRETRAKGFLRKNSSQM